MPKKVIPGIALLALIATVAQGAAPSWVKRSDENSQLLLQIDGKYAPENASQIGVDGFDEAITNYAHDNFVAENRDLDHVIAVYQKRLGTESDPKVKQDLQILITTAQDNLRSRALDRKYFFPYIDMTRRIFGVVRDMLDARIPLERQKTLLIRLEKYSGLAKGYRPATELAKQRTLERIKANSKLLGPFKGEVDTGLAEAPTLLAGIKQLLTDSQLHGWEPSFVALQTQLVDYNNWIRSEILPRARADNRLPAEVYADNLHEYGVDMTPDELIARALTAFAEIRNQMNITAGLIAKERGLPDSDYRAVMRKLKEQQIPTDQLMGMYRDRLTQIEAAVRDNHIATLPERAAVIRLATPAENAQQPAPHMNPPRLIGNTGEYGEFVLTTGMSPDASGKSLPFDDFSHQAMAWTLTAHEARPGHELQFARMVESGVSIARAVFAFNSVNVEGWALYAEAEMQPYEPLDGQLFALQARAQRAARAFLDPMINLGQLAPERAKLFLMDELCLSEGMATQEMQRYVFRGPGQATSYFNGYQRLMETRQAAQLALGTSFNRQAFNDFVLAQGLLPPRLLRQAVMDEFVPAQRH